MAGESKRQRYLKAEIAKLGGRAEKFSSPANRGVPDQLVLWPRYSINAHRVALGNYHEDAPMVEFAEIKADGKKPTLLQLKDHEKRRAMGFMVHVLGSDAAVEAYLKSRGKK
jgi:uncharacterized protein involved in outer membrane biogenesis